MRVLGKGIKGAEVIQTMADIFKQSNNYKENHCWQFDIRIKNKSKDIAECGLSEDEIQKLNVSDFVFKPILFEEGKTEATNFIKKHEWLGNLSQYTTHWFGAYLHNTKKGLFGLDILSGVILMNVPNSFSNLLGNKTSEIERLISRGACISWSPKNLASSFLMWCIDWMVKNTQFRLFSAYSDPMAKELGTIYQACNFYYLGKKSGAKERYINPYTGKIVSDRFFRQRSAYKKFARELKFGWEESWTDGKKIVWQNMPIEISSALKAHSKKKQLESKNFKVPLKHKYVFVLGKSKSETKTIRKLFLSLNEIKKYPKERGN